MAFQYTYRTLFEVKLIHEFLIEDTTVYWSQSNEQARHQYLTDLGYQIADLLTIVPNETTRSILRKQRMRFVLQPDGFRVAVAVNSVMHAGTLHYSPYIPISEGMAWQFEAIPKVPYFQSLSGISLRPAIRGSYLLDNRTNGLLYPSLSPAPALYNALQAYKMGEIVRDNTGNVYRALKHTDTVPSSSDWTMIVDRQYFTETTPQKTGATAMFYLQPAAAALPLTNVRAVLRQGVTPVLEQQLGGLSNMRTFRLDLTDAPEGYYTLEIFNGASLLNQREIWLTQQQVVRRSSFEVHIGHQAGLGDFRLLENYGPYLRSSSHPVFEVRIPSRLLGWKYIAASTQTLVPDSASDVEQDATDPTQLVTKVPQVLSKFYQPIQFKPSTAVQTFKFPNPRQPFIDELGEEQYYAIIHLPELNF